jgi:uncharacterized protein YpmS
MWIFMTLVAFGLAFMLYALVQFIRESSRTDSTYRRSVDRKISGTQSTRPVTQISKRSQLMGIL